MLTSFAKPAPCAGKRSGLHRGHFTGMFCASQPEGKKTINEPYNEHPERTKASHTFVPARHDGHIVTGIANIMNIR